MTSLLGFALTDPSVPTPSFVIEEERLNKNLHRALDQARRLGVTLRPPPAPQDPQVDRDRFASDGGAAGTRLRLDAS